MQAWKHIKKHYAKYNIVAVGKVDNSLNETHIKKAPYVNFSELLPVVDLVICHGGNGTIYNALKHKIPVLSGPSHPEQYWNARRIQKLGFGEILPQKRTRSIPALIEKWIEKKKKIPGNLKFESYNDDFQKSLTNLIVNDLL